MKISRILHAGYVFESQGQQILFDPIFENPFSRNCYAYPDVEFDYDQIRNLKPAAVFISHYHDDHCSLESLQYLDRRTAIYLYCIHEELFDMIKKLGFLNVYSLQVDISVKVAGFEITPRLALDADVDSIFHIKAEGLNILNVVDAWIDPLAMPKLLQTAWDVVLWPFQTMREIEVIAPSLARPPELPSEWLEQLKLLNPRFVVPSSCQFIQETWSWYRQAYFPISYQYFQNAIESLVSGIKVYRLNPGVSIELGQDYLKCSTALSWVLPKGEQDVDYDYDPNVIVQSTAEIAQQLGELSDQQTQHVLNYCQKDLIEKYNAFSTELNGQWKLVLYDYHGRSYSFCYDLHDGVIHLRPDNVSVSWVTELPIKKLYAAIEDGESLSSMYLRTEGMPHDDISDDPLIVGLFNGVFGSYQKSQLKKLALI